MVDEERTSARATDLTVIGAREFAARLARGLNEQEQYVTWFFGAGCSISSGISAAGGLVEKWLAELFAIRNGSKAKRVDEELAEWASASFAGFDGGNPAMSYADVFMARHPFPADRQREIEMICSAGIPGYGYATLAQLMSHPKYGRFCNTVLTTNFDDLIADALYLYGEKRTRPLVITHEALARYVRTNSSKPLVVKLHGDAHLDPKNLKPELKKIDHDVRQQLLPFLQDRAVIFVGYGGNDESILDFMQSSPARSVASAVYWVSGQPPPPNFLKWLLHREAIRVNLSNFDQLMHLLRGELEIALLEEDRWSRTRDTYYRGYVRVAAEFQNNPEKEDDANALKEASKAATRSLPNAWAYFANANNLELTDPDEAERLYRAGLQAHPRSPLLNGMYGLFLDSIRNNAKGAEPLYRKAVELAPKDSTYLTNLAVFLDNRGRRTEAEQFHQRAVASDPGDAECLGNYAMFLESRGDIEEADKYYLKAIKAAPTDSTYLMNYAIFLSDVAKQPSAAEAYYLRAIEADPKDPVLLVNYAVFLDVLFEGRSDEAEKLFTRALQLGADNSIVHANYARFLNETRDDVVRAEQMYQRAVALSPNDDDLLKEYNSFRKKRSARSSRTKRVA
jgi:Tfp pilus assembly protein PilF